MDYILSGEPSEVEKVIRENRIRVERGVIKFTPAPSAEVVAEDPEDPEADGDTKDPGNPDAKDIPGDDTKDVPSPDDKEAPAPKAKRTKKAE